MKALLITTALAAGFALPAIAQDAASPFQAEAAGPSISASDVIGARIYVTEASIDADAYAGVQEGWEDIGEVHDIILGRDGTVDAVLVDIGGFLGIGERRHRPGLVFVIGHENPGVGRGMKRPGRQA